jgi:protein-S-isoprenylcysteine O-methyltransferase Ste14
VARSIVPAVFAAAAAFTAIGTASTLGHALNQMTTRAWLIAVYGLLRTGVVIAFAVFTIGRTAPHRRTRNPVAYLACAAAMATVLAFSAPGRSTPGAVVLAGELVTVASYVWLLMSVISLGRCFGLLPEARGLVVSGPYGVVRHPVYLGEIGACIGLAIAAPSLKNAAAVAAVITAQSVRMRLEERALAKAFPDYETYAARTPRVLPRPSSLARALGPVGRARARPQHPPISDSIQARLAERV